MGREALDLLTFQLMLQLSSVQHVAPLQTLVNRPGDPGATEGGPADLSQSLGIWRQLQVFPCPWKKTASISISVSQPSCWGEEMWRVRRQPPQAAYQPPLALCFHTEIWRQASQVSLENMRAEVCFPEAIWTLQIHFLNSCRIENPSFIMSVWSILSGLPVFLSKQVIKKFTFLLTRGFRRRHFRKYKQNKTGSKEQTLGCCWQFA